MQGSHPRQVDATHARSGVRHAAERDPEAFAVVAIGASAGGLEAFQKFFDAMPPDNGLAVILVQHLDPKHQSMMVELLAGHTPMKVQHAADGMRIERDGVYIIPPAVYLSVRDGMLLLSKPRERHGARLPFDFLLHSLADDLGERVICVILSGTGTDGSLGLKTVKEMCGLVIAQEPCEASYDGMPRSAIMTGAVDLVLPVAEIPEVLVKYNRRMALLRPRDGRPARHTAEVWLPEIIDLLHAKTAQDFTHYKPGTLQRRIERRMAMATIETDDMERYLDVLRGDSGELDLLARDLLINVTRFFRDPKVFDLLAETVVPELVGGQSSDRPLRIWVPGCSTGEEAYSLAMLLREQITAAKSNIKLKIFASDIDPDALACARDGLYPETIEADLSPERLARFFVKEDTGYRVVPDLRASVVFTVQNVLADPPFSRLDMISCRNLLIYLQPEAQAAIISLFHFALREGGVLLLGTSETIGNADGRFEVASKAERLYRCIGRNRPGNFDFPMNAGDGVRVPARPGQAPPPSRQANLADLCRRLVLETLAPAAILTSRTGEYLYSLGPTDRYLRVAPGNATQDVVAMTREGFGTRLRTTIKQAVEQNARITMAGCRTTYDADSPSFTIVAQPVANEGNDLLLVSFVDEPTKEQREWDRRDTPQDLSRIAELERELDATRKELQDAIRDLKVSDEEQKAINEEALSVNEEFQSTNEELVTSKEELQSLNEELTALNSQLQEALETQRTTSNDLQNILFSTDVATLFLDGELNIRFFTPATKALFNVIPGDVGRPIVDLNSLASDDALEADARSVLRTLAPIEREIMAHDGTWYIRRILPYRAQDDGIEGIVITFADTTERRRVSDALEAARRQAQMANVAKSRFLAAASHDLRQPLQSLILIQGLLERNAEGEKVQKLVARFHETLGAMTGMLNALLDINQIEAGIVRAEKITFPINDLFHRLRDMFMYHAQAQELVLRVVPCGLSIHSDPNLLEQMMRNLVANALKYTERGKVLLGCRRREGMLSIEVWDTGIGIPEAELEAIFEEYHQLDNEARTRSRGIGLGLSIVQRLGKLLGHRVRVASHPTKGSVFAVEVALPSDETAVRLERFRPDIDDGIAEVVRRLGSILIVEDDPEERELLQLLLKEEGHRTIGAPDGVAALELVARGTAVPDLIIADYNLPKGRNGLQVAVKVREHLHRQVPVIILTGDISTGTLRDIAEQNCLYFHKPVKLPELMRVIQRLLPLSQSTVSVRTVHPVAAAGAPQPPTIFVVDDNSHIRDGIRQLLEKNGRTVETYPTCEAFIEAYRPGREACLLIDAYFTGMGGLEMLDWLKEGKHRIPAIMITGYGDVPMVVKAMKAGAVDFIEKPVSVDDLMESVERALEQARDSSKRVAWQENAAERVRSLTPRQRQIMELVLAGHPSKNIAPDLGISQRTVENHRASIMKRMGVRSLPSLARVALAAAETDSGTSTV